MQLSDVKVIIIDEISMVSNKGLSVSSHFFSMSISACLIYLDVLQIISCLYPMAPVLSSVLQKSVDVEFYDELYNIFLLWRNFQMC